MIINYDSKYFDEIVNITKTLWKDEIESSENLQNKIYELLVKKNIGVFNLSYVSYKYKVNAFILSSLYNSNITFDIDTSSLDDNDLIKYQEYKRYLDYNYQMVSKYLDDKSVYIGLVASVLKGEGTRLIHKVISKAKDIGYKKIYLWTDETCNYKYYKRLGFNIVLEYIASFYDKKLKTFIYEYEIKDC